MRLTAPLVVAAGAALLVAGVGVSGGRQDANPQATNLVRPVALVATIAPGATLCQSDERVPGGTGAVRVLASTGDAPGPPVVLRVAAPGRATRHGESPPGWRGGDLAIAIPMTRRWWPDARVCLTNRGASPMSLAGESFPPAEAASAAGNPQPGRARIEYVRSQTASWWSLAPQLARRLAAVHAAAPGAATGYLCATLAFIVAAGALAVVLREGRR